MLTLIVACQLTCPLEGNVVFPFCFQTLATSPDFLGTLDVYSDQGESVLFETSSPEKRLGSEHWLLPATQWHCCGWALQSPVVGSPVCSKVLTGPDSCPG